MKWISIQLLNKIIKPLVEIMKMLVQDSKAKNKRKMFSFDNKNEISYI